MFIECGRYECYFNDGYPNKYFDVFNKDIASDLAKLMGGGVIAEGIVKIREIVIVDRSIIDKKDVGSIVYYNVKKHIGKKVIITLEVIE